MPRIEPLIDAYIDLNCLILTAWCVWALIGLIARRSRFGADPILRLRLTEGLLLLVALSPLIAMGVVWGLAAAAPGASLNAVDFAVAQFLDGHVEMEAEAFERMVGLRQTLVADLAGLKTPLAQAVAALFVLGVLIAGTSVLRQLAHLRGLIGRGHHWRRFGRLYLILSDEIAVPFSTRGLTRRYVVAPSEMLGRPDLMKIALAHELQHMRRRDLEVELALSILRPLFFWNPAFHALRTGVERLRELACDQALVARNRVAPLDYANCLISVCRNAAGRQADHRGLAAAVPFLKVSPGAQGARNRRALSARIDALCAPRAPGGALSPVAAAVLALCALTMALTATSIRRPADWSQDRLMLSTIVNLERLESRTTGAPPIGY